jgi:exo-beta-1,3-glucanase (GH17 family)
LVSALDFIAIHIYPQWEGHNIEKGLEFVDNHVRQIKALYPQKALAITETGWTTLADEFDDRASEAQQTRYFQEILDWAHSNHVTTFWFSAFDAKWKGTPSKPNGAEKHWGLFYSDRTPKPAIRAHK